MSLARRSAGSAGASLIVSAVAGFIQQAALTIDQFFCCACCRQWSRYQKNNFPLACIVILRTDAGAAG
jgi:hypothetical protein